MVEKKSIGEVQSEINADISRKFDELHDRITRLSKILDQHNDRFKQSENKISEILTDMIIFNKWRMDQLRSPRLRSRDPLFCVGDVTIRIHLRDCENLDIVVEHVEHEVVERVEQVQKDDEGDVKLSQKFVNVFRAKYDHMTSACRGADGGHCDGCKHSKEQDNDCIGNVFERVN